MASFKMVWRKHCQILEHKLCRNFKALRDTSMKTMKKNAKEHSINEVMQELSAAGLHSLLTKKSH